jgi:hypothetical protein
MRWSGCNDGDGDVAVVGCGGYYRREVGRCSQEVGDRAYLGAWWVLACAWVVQQPAMGLGPRNSSGSDNGVIVVIGYGARRCSPARSRG